MKTTSSFNLALQYTIENLHGQQDPIFSLKAYLHSAKSLLVNFSAVQHLYKLWIAVIHDLASSQVQFPDLLRSFIFCR